MPKRNLNPISQDSLELEDSQDEIISGPKAIWHRTPVWLRATGGVVLFSVLVIASFDLVYAGKIYPGVTVDGVDVGGLSRSAAQSRLGQQVAMFSSDTLTVTNYGVHFTIPVSALSLKYNTLKGVQLAADFGHEGSPWNQLHQVLRSLLGRSTSFDAYSYGDNALTPLLLNIDSSISTPVADAGLSFDGDQAQVTQAQSGARLDLGMLTQSIRDRLATTSDQAIAAPVYHLAPQLATGSLQAAVGQIASLVSAPITLSYFGTTKSIDQSTLVSWMQAGSNSSSSFLQTLNLRDIYPRTPPANVGLNRASVEAYVASLAAGVDKSAQNAILAVQNGQPVVTQASVNGVSIDQTATVSDIIAALSKTGSDRTVKVPVETTLAAVNETDLPDLGITQLISQGETYFPGSPYARLVNVRTGAARFNDLLISPGEVFSVGAQLGEVDASTGYLPELVIDGNHEDFQYGGGLCQVTTTAFRAALAAGLPIDERQAHSFAISYYQWPYGAPGVDATIYYPEVDLKFTNDTGHYILIQTVMSGDDLKFEFYGTKTKQGVIRGPYFISGSNNAKQSSHTVFYRDVEDLSGNVIKTDTFNSYYQPSTSFPIVNNLSSLN
jgi:vancomycin resistance protein YoaR